MRVILPCDLPSWSYIQSLLWTLVKKPPVTTEELIIYLLRVREITNISVDSINDTLHSSSISSTFDILKSLLNTYFPTETRTHILQQLIPRIARFALCLPELLPSVSQNFVFNLQHNTDEFIYDRRFVASLLANIFFSTFPNRSSKNIYFPISYLPEVSFQSLLSKNPVRLREFLEYFELLDKEEPCGHVYFSRRILGSIFEEYKNDKPLTGLTFVLEEEYIGSLSFDTLFLQCSISLEQLSHPESLILPLFFEDLNVESREYVKISGLLSKSNFSQIKIIIRNIGCFDIGDLNRDLSYFSSLDSTSKESSLLSSKTRYLERNRQIFEEDTKNEIKSNENSSEFSSQSSFKSRLRAAYERGNTPESLSTPNSPLSSILHRRRKSSDGFILDSGFEFWENEKEYEREEKIEFFENEFRLHTLKHLQCLTLRKCLSETFLNVIWENETHDSFSSLFYNVKKRRLRTAISFDLEDSLLLRTSVHEDEKERKRDASYS